MNEEKYQKDGISCWKGDASNDIYCFRHSDWMWRLFFPHLSKEKTVINKLIKNTTLLEAKVKGKT